MGTSDVADDIEDDVEDREGDAGVGVPGDADVAAAEVAVAAGGIVAVCDGVWFIWMSIIRSLNDRRR